MGSSTAKNKEVLTVPYSIQNKKKMPLQTFNSPAFAKMAIPVLSGLYKHCNLCIVVSYLRQILFGNCTVLSQALIQICKKKKGFSSKIQHVMSNLSI